MIIPFFIPHAGCPHQCVFCNQKGITGKTAQPDPAEVAFTIKTYLSGSSAGPAEVAFYGGSFTALPLELQRSYLGVVQPFIETGAVAGIRLSTRPDAVSAGILELLKQHHVRTVELGAQSMDDSVLMRSGRGHFARDTDQAARLLQENGFALGIQLMPGLPGDSAAIFAHSVGKVIELRPDIVRIYPTLVIKETPLEALYRSGGYVPLSLDEAIAWCRDALVRFESAGINVVRIGLQPSEELERPGTIVAGPYHPAFRQLVGSSLLLENMRSLLGTACHGAEVVFSVNPRDLSTAIGQKKRNVHILRQEFGLASVRFEPDNSVLKGRVRPRSSCFPSSCGV